MPSPNGIRAWQAAIQVAVRTRALLEKLPRTGYAEMRDQMTRSSESIGNNIADGRGSKFKRQYISFLDTAAMSARELGSQLTTLMEYDVVPNREAFNLRETAICVGKMIESLRDTEQANLDAEQARLRANRRRDARGKRKRNT